MNDSIFTKIIRGEIPSQKIYEDDKTFAFLDIRPKQPGHTLVIPKAQIGKVYDLDDTNYRALWASVQKVALHMEKVLGRRVATMIIGVDIPDHAHVNLIPFDGSKDLDLLKEPEEASEEELTAMADRLRIS
ncbi:HIT domain-containing protein [Candidatus Saccharibacteria bacterium]|nr:HIT domain-containing protein [Candidatus Saccharibacteria bacterium]